LIFFFEEINFFREEGTEKKGKKKSLTQRCLLKGTTSASKTGKAISAF